MTTAFDRLLRRPAYDRADPRNHWCAAPGCAAWGAFGTAGHWFCGPHRPAPPPDGTAPANAVRAPVRGQGSLL